MLKGTIRLNIGATIDPDDLPGSAGVRRMGIDVVNQPLPDISNASGVAQRISATMRAPSNTLSVNLATGTISATPGNPQTLESTFTVATTTTAGTINLSITSVLTGTYNLPVTLAAGRNQAQVTSDLADAIANSPIAEFYEIGTESGKIILTSIVARPNDASLAIIIPTAIGIAAGANTITGAGLGGVTFDLQHIEKDGLVIAAGSSLQTMNDGVAAAAIVSRLGSATADLTANDTVFKAAVLPAGSVMVRVNGYGEETPGNLIEVSQGESGECNIDIFLYGIITTAA